MAWRWVKGIREWAGRLLLALAMVLSWSAAASSAAPKTAKKEPPAVCKQPADKDADAKSDAKSGTNSDDNDDEAGEDDEGVRFDLAGACAKLTAGVSYTYQQAKKTASGLPVIVNRNGTVSNGTSSNSVSANIGLGDDAPD